MSRTFWPVIRRGNANKPICYTPSASVVVWSRLDLGSGSVASPEWLDSVLGARRDCVESIAATGLGRCSWPEPAVRLIQPYHAHTQETCEANPQDRESPGMQQV
jgi:hypothetical protein